MSAITIQQPAMCEPISLSDAKLFLRVTDTANDTLISSLITAAREHCEMFTRRSFINKSFIQYLDSFPYYTDTVMSQQAYPPSYYSLPRYSTTLWNYSQMIKLYFSPLVSIDHLTYIAASDSETPTLLQFRPAPWFPFEYYPLGSEITDSNGKIQQCTTAGTSGLNQPTNWGTSQGNTTSGDGTDGLIWTCTGEVAPASNFIIDTANEPPRLFPVAGGYWPAVRYVPNAVRIYFRAGYNNDDAIVLQVAAWAALQSPAPTQAQKDAYEASLRQADVPQVARTAMFECLTHWYENREAVSALNLKEVPKTVDMLLWGIRVEDAAPTRG